jgi:Mg2+ and Co2+ transporter CorA
LGSGPQALAKHLDEFARVLEHLDKLQEQATDAEAYFTVMHELEPVYRSTRNMQTALQQARTMVPEDRSLINFRDRAVELERSAELLESDTKNDLDLAIARRTEDQARSSHQMAVSAHRLNVLAAIFFPIATLSAIFGVNMQHGWEEVHGPMPFLTMLGAGLLSGFLLSRFVMRKS